MPYVVDFENVSTAGLDSSPVAEALAGLRANEARYFKNKYDHVFTVSPAADEPRSARLGDRASSPTTWARLHLLPPARGDDGIRMAYVFYESGLSINVMYTIADEGKRAVGFKLSEGMGVPGELASRFKFARQKSRLAGVIRGSFFVIKGEYSAHQVPYAPARAVCGALTGLSALAVLFLCVLLRLNRATALSQRGYRPVCQSSKYFANSRNNYSHIHHFQHTFFTMNASDSH